MFSNWYSNCLPERKDIVIIMLNWTEETIAKGRMCVGVTRSFDGVSGVQESIGRG